MNDLIYIKKDKALLKREVTNVILETEAKIKELKATQEKYKTALLKVMQDQNILKVIDEESGLSIRLVEAQKNLEKFNLIEFKKAYPDLYDEFITMDGKRNAYLIIRQNE